MLKRTLFLLLALCLPFVIAGPDQLAGAATGDPTDPPPLDDDAWVGTPDKEEDSGRFFAVSGQLNAGITGDNDNEDPHKFIVTLRFESDDVTEDDVQIRIFDADTGGYWDQRDFLAPIAPEIGLRRPYDTVYRLYADPDRNVARTLIGSDISDPDFDFDDVIPEGGVTGVAPVEEMSALDDVDTDASWTEFMDDPVDAAARIGDTNEYQYTLVVLLEAGDTDLTEYELNGFKLAYTGRLLITAGSIFGFIGGAVDTRTVDGMAQTQDPLPGDTYIVGTGQDARELTNRYQGDWQFRLRIPRLCSDLELLEADADWNKPITPFDRNDPTTWLGDQDPTGVPPDDGGLYSPVGTNSLIDNTIFRVPLPTADTDEGRNGLLWELVPPGETTPVLASYTDGSLRDGETVRHPSVTASRQEDLYPAYTDDTFNEFQVVTLEYEEANQYPPTPTDEFWEWNWRGVDARNLIWITALSDLGEDPDPQVTGSVTCTDERPVADATVTLTLVTKIPDDATNIGTEEGPVNVTTNSLGRWDATDLQLVTGVWSITSITLPPTATYTFTPTPPLPQQFVVDECEGSDVETTGRCDSKGGISGRVFCDNNVTGEYDLTPAPADEGIAGVTVYLTAFGDTTPTTSTTTGVNGTYAFTDVDAGVWTVSVDPDDDPFLAWKSELSPTSRQVTLTGGSSVENVDFWFCCYGDLTGRVYCDNDESEGYLNPPDKPLHGVTVELLQSGNVVATDETDLVGEYEFLYRAVGSYTVRVRESTLPPGVTALGPTSSEELISCEATAQFDFRYRCPASISGHVYRETIDCNGEVTAGDIPIANVEVQLISLSDPSSGPWIQFTNAAGYYEFSPVDPGTYRIQVDENKAPVRVLKASFPTPAVIAPLVVEALGNYPDNDFFFCPGTITVTVVKKQRGENCLNVIETGDTPIAGVSVTLTGANPPVFQQTLVTDPNGQVVFTNLDAGDYEMTVDEDSTPLLLYVPAFGATSADVSLPAGAHIELPSVWCEEPCKISGRVLREQEGCDCDSEWLRRGPLAGVRVELRKVGEPALLEFTTTGARGYYEFDELYDGPYVVSLPDGQRVLFDMTATSRTTVTVLECPAEVNFYYGTASLEVFVLVDVACDGRPDGGLGVEVTLEKLNDPDLGRITKASTDPTTGMVKFPTAGMNALLPGLYKVSIPAQPGLIAQDRLEQTILLRVCDCEELRFVFCGTGSIVGKVWKEICDCDGEADRGELGIPGVEVILRPANTLVGERRTTTDRNGEFFFINLPRGSYSVIVEGQPPLAGLTPSSPTTVNINLIPPSEARADFFFCDRQPARLFGYVFEEPLGECDSILDRGDTGIAGVPVGLAVLGPVGWTVLPPATTDRNGMYAFDGLAPGTYRVSVWENDPLLIDLTATTETEVGPFELDCAEERRVDFGFARQALGGVVYLNPAWSCDEVYDPETDEGLGRIQVTIVKLDQPRRGLTRTAITDAQGVYLFEDIPAGTYEVAVTRGVPNGLRPATPEVVEQYVPICSARRVNFGYCPPLGQICGKVWVNPVDNDCDDTFDRGDVPLVGVTVELEKLDEPFLGRSTTTTTDENGDYCFYRLPAGLYEVRVPGGQPQLVNYRPFGPTEVLVTLPAGGSERVDFPYCEECEIECCVGDLHEVVVETKFWVGYTDEPERRWYDVYAYFFDGCKEGARELDYAGMFYQGDFPGAETGYNDVITIENVRVDEGWAVVRLRLTAQGCVFPRGFFGKKCRTVAVWLNGKWNYGKSVFRCECVRPGSWFTWGEACSFPECNEYFSPSVLSSMILEGRPDGCDARYLTLDTYSWESWVRCERGPRECVEQSERCECGYNYIELELDYWVTHHSDPHKFDLTLEKWGYDIVDGLEVQFTGSEWHGRKVGWAGTAFVTDIWRVSRHEYADLWRVRIHLRACDRIDGNPSALPQEMELATRLDNWRHDFWLSLSKGRCLQLGEWTWEGESIGVNILRWISVMDAAWCPPYICEGGCDRTGYCATCPEPVGCDDRPTGVDCECEDGAEQPSER